MQRLLYNQSYLVAEFKKKTFEVGKHDKENMRFFTEAPKRGCASLWCTINLPTEWTRAKVSQLNVKARNSNANLAGYTSESCSYKCIFGR